MTPRPSPAATVIRATASDAATLSQVIADAFHDLAPSRWLIPNPGARRDIFPAYFHLLTEHALAEGVVHTTLGLTAVALWLPVDENGPGQIPGYADRLPTVTGAWTSRFHTFDAALKRHHPTGIPHYHLAILAVRPDHQDQGLGTALLRAHHAVVDETGVPAYLEASDLRTRQLYLRHGYTDRGVIHLPDGPIMHRMWRDHCHPAAA